MKTILPDSRHLPTGRVIPSASYSDQPYLVRTADGAWLSVLTTGAGREGDAGQHLVTQRSTDQGRTWSSPAYPEPPDGPEASWGVPFADPDGRIFLFYLHNTDNQRVLFADDPPFKGGKTTRMDSHGHYVFKVSHDHGRSWSPDRYVVPVREFAIDRNNVYGGRIRFCWNVGKPFVWRKRFFLPHHKVGGLGEGWFSSSEGVVFCSDNLLTESDPNLIRWKTFPEGEVGLRAPAGGGPVAEEQSLVVLSDGTFYCVYRTVAGYPAYALSHDGGRSWSEPRWQSYADGRPMKHPRAANFIWRCPNGLYLYWFHNHGGNYIGKHPNRLNCSYENRNPAWICTGREIDTPDGKTLAWSEPEILLYDDDPIVRMSYPDLLLEKGRYFLSTTQKSVARVFELDQGLFRGMRKSALGIAVPVKGWVAETKPSPRDPEREFTLPNLPVFYERDPSRADHGMRRTRAGMTVEIWSKALFSDTNTIMLDLRDQWGFGLSIETTVERTFQLVVKDEWQCFYWQSDPVAKKSRGIIHLVAIFDGGPGILSFVLNGKFCDGGVDKPFGWSRLPPFWRGVGEGASLKLPSQGVRRVRIYDRALKTYEAVACWRSGLKPG